MVINIVYHMVAPKVVSTTTKIENVIWIEDQRVVVVITGTSGSRV